jgi:uncharacterized protein (UPF0248 family)
MKKIYVKREKKNKLIPSDKIINKIKWDKKYNIEELTIGYIDRFIGIQEANMEEFETTEIPKHRIVYLKLNDQIIWDREKKIYLLK